MLSAILNKKKKEIKNRHRRIRVTNGNINQSIRNCVTDTERERGSMKTGKSGRRECLSIRQASAWGTRSRSSVGR